ncbi:MAG TPA: PHP domain-containing protein [Anaerolineae bacterium]|nr:PHP domain-containing protein [Anaerolineae bacterium]
MGTRECGKGFQVADKSKKGQYQWRRVDLHIHTPASNDYEQPNVSYLDILRRARERGLDIIAFTDHNTVAGYAAMLAEIEDLELLKRLGRLRPEERRRLDEYRRLRREMLVLPGFEFTATFGFHILGIFSDKCSVRELEHILLDLNIPADKLDEGSTEVGATADVLTAYRLIDEAGGIVIAAHANSAHGVAMRGFGFGGQTKIAYTQDSHLHALEVTDLESKGRHTTAAFYSGSKPEYPRPMRCIQGSDAHRLTKSGNSLGIGDRVTEVLLPEVSFEALREVFLSDDLTLTRPYRPTKRPFDHVRAARERGPSIVQSFHEKMTRRGGRLYAIIADVVAFANTNGGTIYVGVSANPKVPPVGVDNPKEAMALLKAEIERKVTPPLEVTLDVLESEGKKVIRLVVPRGDDPPYAIDNTKIYVRQETETNLAVRDEIVQLVKRSLQVTPPEEEEEAAPEEAEEEPLRVEPPKTGVEIVETVERKGILYHTMRDLRNGNEVRNVTRSSARRLWRYAIVQKEEHPVEEGKVMWRGDIGLWKKSKRAGKVRYDLVQRDGEGKLRVYYGVTDEGLHGKWRQLVEEA